MASITKKEYIKQLKDYINEEMRKLEHDGEPISFWIKFNQDKKVEFDAQLAANNVTIMG